jgi:hypothetical protein
VSGFCQGTPRSALSCKPSEAEQALDPKVIAGVPLTRYWLIPPSSRPKMMAPHPMMTAEEISRHTQSVWDNFYSWGPIWKRSRCTPNLLAHLAFVLLSKLCRQMNANTGISTDSARRKEGNRIARWIAIPFRRKEGLQWPGQYIRSGRRGLQAVGLPTNGRRLATSRA